MKKDIVDMKLELLALLAYHGVREKVEIEDMAVPMLLDKIKAPGVLRARVDVAGGLVIDFDDTDIKEKEE